MANAIQVIQIFDSNNPKHTADGSWLSFDFMTFDFMTLRLYDLYHC